MKECKFVKLVECDPTPFVYRNHYVNVHDIKMVSECSPELVEGRPEERCRVETSTNSLVIRESAQVILERISEALFSPDFVTGDGTEE